MATRYGIRIYKEYFNIAAAHFLIFDNGDREELHGHNYQIQMALEGVLGIEGGEESGVEKDVFIDFLHIKPIVKRVCDAIDHHTLLPQFNRYLTVSQRGDNVHAQYHRGDEWLFPKRDVKILPIPNTSSERLAEYLCHESLAQLAQEYPNARIGKIEFSVEESRGQAAIYRLEFAVPERLTEIVREQRTRSPELARV
jgi:6-pyruvoyltetrahydropterin/6-carboxytetrahydropterin synthase